MDKKPTIKELLAQRTNFAIVNFGYDNRFVMPQKQALALLAAMEGAELMADSQYTSTTETDIKGITDIPAKTITVEVIPEQRYLNTKMAKLLGTSIDEIENPKTPEEPDD